jgi:hypothetical protein
MDAGSFGFVAAAQRQDEYPDAAEHTLSLEPGHVLALSAMSSINHYLSR